MPPGPASFSMRRTTRFARDPLPILLDAYREHGPIFSVRILHAVNVFMLGPEANHYVTVSHAANFNWRDGGLGDLMPLLGDGLLTIDGDYHRRARRIMLPAFHRERLVAATDTMLSETERALAGWRLGRAAGRLPLGARAGAADRDAGAVRLRSRPGRRATPRWRPSSSARWRSTASPTCCRRCAARSRPGGACTGPGAAWTG